MREGGDGVGVWVLGMREGGMEAGLGSESRDGEPYIHGEPRCSAGDTRRERERETVATQVTSSLCSMRSERGPPPRPDGLVTQQNKKGCYGAGGGKPIPLVLINGALSLSPTSPHQMRVALIYLFSAGRFLVHLCEAR